MCNNGSQLVKYIIYILYISQNYFYINVNSVLKIKLKSVTKYSHKIKNYKYSLKLVNLHISNINTTNPWEQIKSIKIKIDHVRMFI